MDEFFGVLLLLTLVSFLVGLVNPNLYSKIFRKEMNRKTVSVYFGSATFVFLFLAGILSDTTLETETLAENVKDNHRVETVQREETEVILEETVVESEIAQNNPVMDQVQAPPITPDIPPVREETTSTNDSTQQEPQPVISQEQQSGESVTQQTEPEPIPTEPQTSQETVATSGKWYVSSHHSSRYYYCETGPWQGLSETFLRVYNTEAELLRDFPNHTLHESCW